MRRFTVGLFFVLHGLGHAAIGMAAQDGARGTSFAATPRLGVALATILFAIAMPGFVAAGFGRWGVTGLHRLWQPLTRAAALASAGLLLLFSSSAAGALVGLMLDAVAVALTTPRIRIAAPSAPGGAL